LKFLNETAGAARRLSMPVAGIDRLHPDDVPSDFSEYAVRGCIDPIHSAVAPEIVNGCQGFATLLN